MTRATAPARPSDRALWVREMRRLQKSYSRKVASPTVNEIPAQQPDDGTCYCDTSALLKLYIAEADSPHSLQLIADGDEPVVSSAIVTAEILCVLCRKEQARALKGGGAIRIYAKFSQDVRLKQ